MRLERQLLKVIAVLLLFVGAQAWAGAGSQVLATVGTLQVTADELNAALASSPFSSKIASMEEDDQAGLRGDMLRRLVIAKLLTLEARRLGLDKTDAYKKDLDAFRVALLYRSYMDGLRQSIVIPDDTLAAMKKQFKQDRDGMDAAKAAYVSDRYKEVTRTAMQNLLKQDNVRLHDERIVAGIRPDTVLAEGTSLKVTYGDVVDLREHPSLPNVEWVKDQVGRRVELLAAANAAAKQGVDVSADMKKYESERLPAVLMEAKTKEWVPNEKALRDWYDKHPDAATVPERRHIGHLVVASQKEADSLRARIIKGESLFVLAGKYSIDPEGRKQKGDMGWIVQGRGMPELDQALAKLKDGETSDVIKTKDGNFHIVTVLERRPARKEAYEGVRERIAQNIVNEKLPPYVGELERRYGVTWNVVRQPAGQPAGKPGK